MASNLDKKALTNLLLSEGAKVLSHPEISRPYWGGRSPRWICRFFNKYGCVPVEGGALRINELTEKFIPVQKSVSTSLLELPTGNLNVSHSHIEGSLLDSSYAQYNQNPKEVQLQPIQSITRFPTRLQTLYSNVEDQLFDQLALIAETIYETKENLIFNHPEYGLLHQVKPALKMTHDGPPSPSLLDDMLSRVWKMPDVWVMHPEALQAFHDEANKLGISLESKEFFGSALTCWRGLPILPTNKLYLINDHNRDKSAIEKTVYNLDDRMRGQSKTHVVLLRIGEKKQGAISLFPKGMTGSKAFPLIDIDFMGIDEFGNAKYMLSTYSAIAILTPGALAVAEVVV